MTQGLDAITVHTKNVSQSMYAWYVTVTYKYKYGYFSTPDINILLLIYLSLCICLFGPVAAAAC